MNIRRTIAYFGFCVAVALLLYGGLGRYEVHYATADGKGVSDEKMSVSGFGLVFESARDGVGRAADGRLVSRRYRLTAEGTIPKELESDKGKDADTCYT